MIVEPLPWCCPADAAERLRPLGTLAFFDSAMRHPTLGCYSYVAAEPFGILAARGGRASWNKEPVAGAPLQVLGSLLRDFAQPRDLGLPRFQGGAMGLLSYELGLDLQRLPRMPAPPWSDGADLHLPFYDVVVAFDHETEQAWIIGADLPRAARRDRDSTAGKVRRFRACIEAAPPASRGHACIGRDAWQSNFTAAAYRDAVRAVIAAILDGEIFQANIAQRFAAAIPPEFDAWHFYKRLRAVNPAPFAAFLDQGMRTIASSSPELFVTLDRDWVETRPIKGTARRSPDPDADRHAAERLRASTKDRAENTMIVDLLRNDLSRVCLPHTVAVPTLCGLETYAGVHHLVSSVTGRLKPDADAIDLLAAAFPGGSVTGAPKHQAMQVISRIEREARGAYCGSLAWFGFDGAMATNIAIRTVTMQNGHAAFHAGGGITALSDPAAEYQETLDKAERIFQAFEGE